MADLITMQPNLNIPLYIVAPVDRRNKVIEEINRPTFARLSPPMAEICQFISFEELRKQTERAAGLLQFLKPEFLHSFSLTAVYSNAPFRQRDRAELARMLCDVMEDDRLSLLA